MVWGFGISFSFFFCYVEVYDGYSFFHVFMGNMYSIWSWDAICIETLQF